MNTSYDGNCSSSSSSDQNQADSKDEGDNHCRAVPRSSRPIYDPASKYYDMTGERLLYVFNHVNYYKNYATTRLRTEYDMKKLRKTFEKVKFKVDEPYIDYTHEKILDQLHKICEMDHSRTSCVAFVISSHGGEGHKVLAYDRPYPISDVVNRVLNEPRLAGKPKLFFIQACRGGNTDAGLRIQIDGRVTVTIPTHSDCLVVMASFDGTDHVAFRGKGSWMLQDLCEVVDEHHEDTDVLSMVTLVNNKVSARLSSSSDPTYNDKKQIPETRFTLTKFIKF